MPDSIKVYADPINRWLIVSGSPKTALCTVIDFLKDWNKSETEHGWFLSVLMKPDFLERATMPEQIFTLYSRYSSNILAEMVDGKLRIKLYSKASWFSGFLKEIKKKLKKS